MTTPHTTAIRQGKGPKPTHAACSNCSRMFVLLSGKETLCGNCLGALVEDVEEDSVVTPLGLAMQTALASITELRHERDQALARAAAAEGKLSLAHTLYANFLRSVLPEHTMKDFKEYEAVLWNAACHEMWRCKSIEGDKNRAETALAEALAKLAACEGLLSRVLNTDHSDGCFRTRPDPACDKCEAIRQSFAHLSQSKGSDHG